MHTNTSVAAVFPAWAALNNAILLDPPSTRTASQTAEELADIYAGAGAASWALWLPSPALGFDEPDIVGPVDDMVRDTTTLVMTLDLSDGMPSHPGVLRTTVEAASLAGDEPASAHMLSASNTAGEIDGWVLVVDEWAVAGAWTFRNGYDVGVYAVGTALSWRRRGLATALMLHVLADAYRHGARTASLQSTQMGEPLYRLLGFRPVGRYEEWTPAGHGPTALGEAR
jgi:GNAT superfamily N-acetyltransferase